MGACAKDRAKARMLSVISKVFVSDDLAGNTAEANISFSRLLRRLTGTLTGLRVGLLFFSLSFPLKMTLYGDFWVRIFATCFLLNPCGGAYLFSIDELSCFVENSPRSELRAILFKEEGA